MGAASGMGSGGMGGGQQGQFAPPPRMPSNYPTFSIPTVEGVLSPGAYGRIYSQEGQNMGGLPAMDQSIRDYVKENMGNYGVMVNKANELQLSQGDVSRAAGVPMSGVYTYMNRPNYQQYGPNGQFYQPIYQPNYGGYAQPSYFYSPSYSMQSPFSYPQGGYGSISSSPAARSAPMNTIGGIGVGGRLAEGGQVDDNPGDDEGIRALLGRQ